MPFFDKLWPAAGKPQTMQTNEDAPKLTSSLQQNVDTLKETFGYPANISFKIRELTLSSINLDAVLLFLEGAADTSSIEKNIVEPLLCSPANLAPGEDIASGLLRKTLTVSTGKTINSIPDIVRDILNGNTIILLENIPTALSIETPGFEKRSISAPKIENVLKGPKESFVESGAVNRSLIRKQIKDPHLMSEMMMVGEKTGSQISILYLSNVADPQLLDNVKQRIRQIETDALQDISILEQHLEERPYSLVPSILVTERPDRACSFLLEGHVVLLMENSPYALIAPVTFWSLFHTAEDMYLRWAYGNFLRLIRLMAVFVALMTPSIYIAVSTFHEEMIQTDLLLAIAATRERVPFPATMEVILMETVFELVREASVRIPTIIGPTIGIVGALILGNAAVDANLISPILVIVVAITGLSSFAIAELSFNFGVRILRFINLIFASFMGFYGISLFLAVFLAYLVSLKSFDVPFLSPLAPHARSSKDLIVRPPVWKMWLRPFNISPVDKRRRKKPEGSSNA